MNGNSFYCVAQNKLIIHWFLFTSNIQFYLSLSVSVSAVDGAMELVEFPEKNIFFPSPGRNDHIFGVRVVSTGNLFERPSVSSVRITKAISGLWNGRAKRRIGEKRLNAFRA